MRRSTTQLWMRRIGLWLPPLLLLVASVVGLVVYRTAFAGEAAVSRDELARAEERLASLEAKRHELEALIGRIEENRQRIATLYREDFSTEERRLTEIIREVRRLAREASLEPTHTAYPEESLEEYGLVQRSFVFSVEGTYFDLRKLINSLELSDSFLTLEEVALAEGGEGRSGATLRISLRLSTLFAAGDELGEAAPAEREPGEGAA